MKNKRRAIVIPGFTEPTDHQKYTNLRDAFCAQGFDATIHGLDWSTKRMHTWVQEIVDEASNVAGPLTLLGFSMGGMTALIAATKIKVDNLILCSPSGYFLEYEALFSHEDHEWSAAHFHDYADYSISDILPLVNVWQGFIFAGEIELREWVDFKTWTGELSVKTNWPLTVISNTGHDINDPAYQTELHHLIENL